MARKALSADNVDILNQHGPPNGMGDRWADVERAGYLEFQHWENPALGAVAAIHAAVTDTGADQTITTGIIQPDFPRNVSATAGGTGGDIKATQVIVYGTDIDDNVISETLPIFTVNTPGTVLGSKAFKTITSFLLPVQDGLGATISIGTGSKLGFKKPLVGNTVLFALADEVYETTRPTVAFSIADVAANTVSLNTALDGAKDVTVVWLDMRNSDVSP